VIAVSHVIVERKVGQEHVACLVEKRNQWFAIGQHVNRVLIIFNGRSRIAMPGVIFV